jgi:hypothetical protein
MTFQTLLSKPKIFEHHNSHWHFLDFYASIGWIWVIVTFDSSKSTVDKVANA